MSAALHDPAGTAAVRLARRLYRFGDHPVRTLEAVAEAEANRLCREPGAAPGRDAPVPDDALYRVCRRIARRALTARRGVHVEGACHYHPVDDNPVWARDRRPVARVGEIVFYPAIEGEWPPAMRG